MCLLRAPRISLGFGIKRELLLRMDEGVRVCVDESTALYVSLQRIPIDYTAIL